MNTKIPIFRPALVFTLALSCACSTQEFPPVSNSLCEGNAGFGMRITMPAPVDICVPDGAVVATYEESANDAFRIESSFDADGVTYDVSIRFLVPPILPTTLVLSADSTIFARNPNSVWFCYREEKPPDYQYRTLSVTGNFRVSFADRDVAVGGFDNMTIVLTDSTGVDSLATRTIAQGFFSVSPDK